VRRSSLRVPKGFSGKRENKALPPHLLGNFNGEEVMSLNFCLAKDDIHKKKEKTMKKTVFVLALALVFGLAFYAIKAEAQMGPWMMHDYGMAPGMMGWGGNGGWYCPYCGQYMGPGGGYGMGPPMMGPGMIGPHMRGHGWMGPGMMGPGYGPQYGPQYGYQQPQKPMEEKDAKAILENYLASLRNPNLKLGKVKEKGNAFEGEIVTKDGSLVDKILVDKYTGWMRSVY
jgi:hypothetical protein